MSKDETKDNTVKGTVEFETQVIGLLKDMNKSITGIDDRLSAVEATQGPKNATEATNKAIDVAKEVEPPVVDDTVQEHKLSEQYVKIVKDTLGDQFDAWEDYIGVPPSHFRFVISVPFALSSIPKETHTKAKCNHAEKICKVPPDLRSKVISFGEGENGVREWCKRVRLNLNKFYTQNAIQTPFSTMPE